MGHGHLHPGESVSSYFTEQLLAILVCGLFGLAAVLMYMNGKLEFLAEGFRQPVFYGGIGLLVLVGLRAVAVWKEAGELQAQAAAQNGMVCGIEHTHTADCSHDPNIGGAATAADHDHSHSHDMSWTFTRMLILVFPVFLFFLGLPNATLGDEAQKRMLGNDTAFGAEALKDLAKDAEVTEDKTQSDGVRVRTLKSKSGLKLREITPAGGGEPKLELIAGTGTEVRFNDLNDAAYDEGKRKSWEGETVILEGKFQRLADKEFTVYRLKMTCCAADTVPLKVRIIAPQSVNNINFGEWVRVEGQVQFLKTTGKDGSLTYIPTVLLADNTKLQKIKAKSEYEQ